MKFNNPLDLQDVHTLKDLLKITGIRYLELTGEEIRKIVPEQKRIETFSEGRFALHTFSVSIRDPSPNYRRFYSVELAEYYKITPPENYDESIDWHYSNMFNLLTEIFGFPWIIEKVALQISKQFDAISMGQAEAVLKKFIIKARNDEVLTSTTRTQLHRLRQKLTKYRLLIDAFEPLMINENPDLEEIANSMPTQYVYGQGPHFTTKGMVGSDVISFGGAVVAELNTEVKMEKAPPMKEYGTSEEILETRKKLVAEGLDPDGKIPAEDYAELESDHPLSGYRFFCQWCEHSEPFDLNEQGKINPKIHHGQPMFLKIPRSNSDY